MHHQIRVGLLHCGLNGCGIAQIHLLKLVPIVRRFAQLAQHLLNRGQVAGIAHLVEIEDGDCGLPQQPAHDGAANEAGTSGDQTLRRSPSRSEAEGMDETIGESVGWGVVWGWGVELSRPSWRFAC